MRTYSFLTIALDYFRYLRSEEAIQESPRLCYREKIYCGTKQVLN